MNIKSLLVSTAAALATVTALHAASLAHESPGKCTLAKPDMIAAAGPFGWGHEIGLTTAAPVDTNITAAANDPFEATDDPFPGAKLALGGDQTVLDPQFAALPAWDDDGTFGNATNLS